MSGPKSPFINSNEYRQLSRLGNSSFPIPREATDLSVRFSDNPGESTHNGWNIRQPVRRNILNNFEEIQYSNLPPDHPCDPTHKMGVFFKGCFLIG